MITCTTNAPLESLDTLVVPLFETEDMSAQLQSLPDAVREALAPAVAADFTGKKFGLQTVYAPELRILAVGLGKEADTDIRRYKHAVGIATIAAEKNKIDQMGMFVPPAVAALFDATALGEATAIAVQVGDYAYEEFQSEDARPVHISACSVLGVASDDAVQAGLDAGLKIGAAINFTRELGNTPPSVMTPALLAERASSIAASHDKLNVKVLEQTDMEALGMGCLLGVAQGSELAPKFIIMEFLNGDDGEDPVVLVGKGITFDSGGLSLKPANYMTDMKFDMLGAGTALGVMHAAVHLDLPKNLVVLVPSAENMPGGKAFRPDDVLTAMNGKTVEIGNTDAEGRLILADALSYTVANYKPELVIDFATLTGACVVALGTERSAFFTKDASIAAGLEASAKQSGEWIWQLPLGDDYTEMMKSPIADIANISDSRYGGASTAAAFLEFFTLDHESGEAAYPWAHFDLSSAYKGKSGKPWQRYGATGDVVQTVLGYIRNS